MRNIELESERLIYKRVNKEHISTDYVNWINDPEVNTFLETRGGYTLELLNTYIENQYEKEAYFWAIHLKETRKHIGNIKIDPIDIETKSGEYGILIGDKESWGKGYAKEATNTILNFCFNELALSKVTLGVIENNVSAVALYKKIGFKIDKIIIGTKEYNHQISNSLRMSINA